MLENDIEVKELNIKIYIIEDIHNKKSLEEISNLIDNTLSKDQKYLELHKANKYKNYNFSSFYPPERSKIYLKGNIYTFRLRSIDKALVEFLKEKMQNEYTKTIKVLDIKERNISRKHIEKLYSITPAVAKFNEGYWRSITTIDTFEKRLKENLIKKYNDFFKTKMDEDFQLFTNIKFDNMKPVGVNYKDIVLLGDKITLIIDDNEKAQCLAYLALGTGILENNGRGCGYCNFKYM